MKPISTNAIFLFSVLMSGCATIAIERSISKFEAVIDQVHLGDTKEHVLQILEHTQEDISQKYRKRSEALLDGTDRVEIMFFRSARISDNHTTDDEFTPLKFVNDKLVSIGWEALGGPKTHGDRSRPLMPLYQHKTE